ncbi:MucBP domain-containing protein [Enterococcus sp. BWB1-3]|uniref:MucBP domain-containing protein n=1 Tax=Enterococcus sp. BWB1-3 TaxID=2787713 RepID=UPI001921A7A9|nr:MucBP domain-containing protein [Enterococcus sp. BWB1-3]MBL1228022.1 MucBP domain-containing protein [Enterococcus sp. BWB1-3]
MSKTNKQNQLFKGEVTNKKQMYKAKKQWVVAGATVAMGLGIIGLSNTTEVHADTWVPNTAEEIATRLDVNSGSYTFIEGDTYWELAQVLNIKPFKLMEMNGLSDGDQYTIPVGHVVHWDGNHVTVKDTEGNTVSDVVIRDEDKVDPSKPVAGQNSDTPKIPVQSDNNGNVIGNTNSSGNNGANSDTNNSNNLNGNNSNSNANNDNNGGTNTEKPNGNDNNNNEEKPAEPETPVTPEAKQYTVSVLHQDEEGNILLKESDVKVDENATFTAEAKSFDGYTLEGTATQEVKVDSDKVIIFTYKKNENPTPEVEKFDIVIKYLDTEGNELATADTVKVEKGESYTATAKTVEGYSLDGEATQTVTVDSNTDIVFTYTKNTAPVEKFKISVEYKAEDGTVLDKDDAIEVEKGQVFTATAKTFNGYTLKGSTTQTITVNGNSTITFTYVKDAEPITKYKVTVEHKDTDGNILEAELAVEVEQGKTFTAISKEFSGYTLQGNNSQTITVTADTTITFVYQKEEVAPIVKYNITVQHLGSDGTTLETEPVIQVEEGQSFTANAKEFNGYTLEGNAIQTITVTTDATITFNYTKNEVTPPTEDLQAIANQIAGSALGNVNAYRKSVEPGLLDLVPNGALQSGTTTRAVEIATLYDHSRPNGSDFDSAVYEAGYQGFAVNENIGKFENTSLEWIKSDGATQLVNAWINSTGHANNMLNSGINEGAVGAYITKNADGSYNLYFAFIGGLDESKPVGGREINMRHELEDGTYLGDSYAKGFGDSYTPTEDKLVDGFWEGDNWVEIEPVSIPTVDLTNEGENVDITIVYRKKVTKNARSLTPEVTVKSTIEATLETSEAESEVEPTEESAVVEQPETVDKLVLIEIYNTSNTLSEETYSVESWNHFILVKAEVKQVFDDSNATQQQVDEATSNLKNAINNLN